MSLSTQQFFMVITPFFALWFSCPGMNPDFSVFKLSFLTTAYLKNLPRNVFSSF